MVHFSLSFWTECKYELIKFFGKCSFESILLCLKTKVDSVFSLFLKLSDQLLILFNLKVFIVLICPSFPN